MTERDAFRTRAFTETPLRIVVVGAGPMGRWWIATIDASSDAELVGLVDIDETAATRSAVETGHPGLPTGTDVVELIRVTRADAIVDATSPVAHHPVNVAALNAGVAVLCEKPITATLAEALSLAAVSEATGRLLMTSQSRRYEDSHADFRARVRTLGALNLATTEYFMDPVLPGFREQMAHPLLIDMAIHTFDTARYLLDAEPLSVYCEAFNPGWSRFAGSSAATAVFEMTRGIRYVYAGSWSSPGLETSWNGSWRVSGERGSATWDGQGESDAGYGAAGPLDTSALPPEWSRPAGSGQVLAGSLAEFVRALRTGATPSGEIHSNIASLAMVEGAVRSAATGRRESIAELLDDAYRTALGAEPEGPARERLALWGSGTAALR